MLDNSMVVVFGLLTLSVIGAVISVPVITNGCPEECKCKGTRISCGNRLNSVPESPNRDNKFTEIDLSNNVLQELDSEALFSYPNLQKIILTNSGVKKIDPYAFSDLKDLTDVRLDKNDIEHLDQVFDFNPKFKRLDLSRNPLNLSSPTPFPDSVEILELRRCYLEILPDDVFDGLDKLETLDLRHNNLRKIPHKIFELGKITRIFLHDNRLLCDAVENMLLSNQQLIADYEKVRCFAPDGKERRLPWRVLSHHAQDASSGEGVAITSSSKGKVETSATATPQHSDSVPAYHSDGGGSSTTSGKTIRESPVAAVENVTSHISQPPGEHSTALSACNIIIIVCSCLILLLIVALGCFCYRKRQDDLNSFHRVSIDESI